MTMDYICIVHAHKGNLAVFESSNIFETGEATPTKIGVHVHDINHYLHEFFEPIPINKFFDDHGLYMYSPCSKGNLAVFESSNISETGEATPTKIGVHALDISPYLHEILLFLKVAISPKPGKPRPLKLVCMHLTSIPTGMNFLSRFRSIKFFDDHGLYYYKRLVCLYSSPSYRKLVKR